MLHSKNNLNKNFTVFQHLIPILIVYPEVRGASVASTSQVRTVALLLLIVGNLNVKRWVVLKGRKSETEIVRCLDAIYSTLVIAVQYLM